MALNCKFDGSSAVAKIQLLSELKKQIIKNFFNIILKLFIDERESLFLISYNPYDHRHRNK